MYTGTKANLQYPLAPASEAVSVSIEISDTFLEKRLGRGLTSSEKSMVSDLVLREAQAVLNALVSMTLTGESLHDLFNPEAATVPSLFESLTDEQIAEMRGEQTDNWIEPDIGPDLDSNDSTEEVK